MQYRTAFSKPYWAAGLGSPQSTAKSTLTHWRVAEHWNSAKIMQKESKKYRRMGKPAWPYDISSRIIEVRYRKPQVWRDFCGKGHAVGARFAAGPLSLLPDLNMGSSKAAVLCMISLSTAYKFLGIVLNWPNLEKLAVTSQPCMGFSCPTWEGVISMEKGCILLSRYFCDVNGTPCSG